MADAEVLRFLRAAIQRLDAVDVLVANRKFLDGTYLAGYVVECSLKAVVLSYVPVSERSRFVEEQFRGAGAHDYEFLIHLLYCHGVNVPRGVRQQVTAAGKIWSTDLRYDSGKGRPAQLKTLRNAGEFVLKWATRSVT